jgi:sulfur transfer protein SufE
MAEAQGKGILLKNNTLYLNVEVAEDATVHSSFSDDCRISQGLVSLLRRKKANVSGRKSVFLPSARE